MYSNKDSVLQHTSRIHVQVLYVCMYKYVYMYMYYCISCMYIQVQALQYTVSLTCLASMLPHKLYRTASWPSPPGTLILYTLKEHHTTSEEKRERGKMEREGEKEIERGGERGRRRRSWRGGESENERESEGKQGTYIIMFKNTCKCTFHFQSLPLHPFYIVPYTLLVWRYLMSLEFVKR